MNNALSSKCRVNTNIENDTFVGLERKDDGFEVSFPLGYHLSNNEKELKKDILTLLDVLSRYTEKKDSKIKVGQNAEESLGIPIKSYLYLIKDYFERGYYKERYIHREQAKRGKVDWNRTIKTQKSFIQGNEAYYLDFIVKKNEVNGNELITLIHKYCVYECFDKLGWLFTSFVPPKPQIVLNKKQMITIVNDKLQNTFNDRSRELFVNMLAVIKSINDDGDYVFKYGTNRFEYVWEKMIDKVFGIKEKEHYFPKTTWSLTTGTKHDNDFLEPDSIMLVDGKVYVLDAKYYKYGWSGKPGHLPGSTSVNKQITYGEYIAEEEKYMYNGNHPTVYNAFIMPYDAKGKTFYTEKHYHYIGAATSDWKTGEKTYENIEGILLDIKYLMKLGAHRNQDEILELAKIIKDNCPI